MEKIYNEKISAKIMDKVTELEKNSINFNRCLNVRICPKCGNKLNYDIKLKKWNNEKTTEKFKCLSCKFKYINVYFNLSEKNRT
ncbi:MAG: hypothetical protein U9Q27_00130 [Patescibacteria group bacterium]|nr:hypothetical protein [Patescibacteria group bacterium]